MTFFYGIPTILTSIEDTQQVAFAGLPIAMSIATRGIPDEAPPGLDLHSPEAVENDLKRPLANGSEPIGFINVLLWLVATGIIGSIIYLSALERVRDFVLSRFLAPGMALAVEFAPIDVVQLAGIALVIGFFCPAWPDCDAPSASTPRSPSGSERMPRCRWPTASWS